VSAPKYRPVVDKPQPPRRLALWLRDPRCFWCGRVTNYDTAGRGNSATLEHVYPRGHPRRSDPDKHLPPTLLACHKCNTERGAPQATTSQTCPVIELAKRRGVSLQICKR
jgi:hypothetical protein